MSEDMRMVKFQMMIEKMAKTTQDMFLERIAETTDNVFLAMVANKAAMGHGQSAEKVRMLKSVFDKEKLNPYSQFIIENVTFPLFCMGNKYGSKELNADGILTYKIKAKALTAFLGDINNKPEVVLGGSKLLLISEATKYFFLFWMLYIYAIDDIDDDTLSLICDIAQITQITDDQFTDIALFIKSILLNEEATYATNIFSEKGPLHPLYQVFYSGNDVNDTKANSSAKNTASPFGSSMGGLAAALIGIDTKGSRSVWGNI